ncbi:hypothetical protein [Actinospica sp.]|jgi:hypothetical protein|uniref:hypothetical protein n=1 Tax=Actinospica sp. TaxID=1872142 RepID=UPI002C9FE5F9|nr:hypothetical protein [Actinospica sp.]HWG27428.1 hypothetical protein [Actinospica sp.]
MLKPKTTRIAATAATALGAVGLAVGLTGTAFAATAATTSAAAAGSHAAAVHVHPNSTRYTCNVNGYGICAQLTHQTALYSPQNDFVGNIPQGAWVEVTCWYPSDGATYDGEWDHVTWESSMFAGNSWEIIGHVDDDNVDFDGLTANSIGMPQCGIG